MKILVLGPSSTRSKGGMSTVIREMEEDKNLRAKCHLDFYESFIDGGKLKRLFFSIVSYLKFVITKRNYDLYHIHMASRGSTFRKGYYLRAARRWGKKVIVHIHGAQYMDFYEACSEKKKRQVVEILKATDLVIALSDEWRRRFETTFGLTNCISIPNGINENLFAEAVCDMEKHANELLFLGRMGERKGTYDLLNAMELAVKENPSLKLYLAGDGEIDRVQALVKQKNLGHNIQVVGWADLQKKLRLLKKTSILVLPSYNEGLPMAILEAMAAGKAIISTTVGAIPEVITDENGILITPGDVNALAQAILRCTGNTKMLKQMSMKNQEKIHTSFSMKIMHEQILGAYRTVLHHIQ